MGMGKYMATDRRLHGVNDSAGGEFWIDELRALRACTIAAYSWSRDMKIMTFLQM
jgi:hypothetical protein